MGKCRRCESWKIRYGWVNIVVTVFLVLAAAYILFTLPAVLESQCCLAYNENKKQCFMENQYEVFRDDSQELLAPDMSVEYGYDRVVGDEGVLE